MDEPEMSWSSHGTTYFPADAVARKAARDADYREWPLGFVYINPENHSADRSISAAKGFTNHNAIGKWSPHSLRFIERAWLRDVNLIMIDVRACEAGYRGELFPLCIPTLTAPVKPYQGSDCILNAARHFGSERWSIAVTEDADLIDAFPVTRAFACGEHQPRRNAEETG